MEPTTYDEPEPSRMNAAKAKLGQLGRKLKRVEVRESIVAHPLRAIGVVAAVGALVGLVRPMPERSRVGNAVIAGLSAIGLRLVREAATRQLTEMAKGWLHGEA
jgi:hypothetical protein